jgi:uncharacterized protein YhbP (UPF0306 family)
MDVEQIVRENITKTIHMSLATCVGNKPWVCELHFAYDDNLNLYFRSKENRRHSQEIALNSQVAGNIVKQHALEDEVVGLYFEGVAEVLQNVDENHPAYIAISEKLGMDESIISDSNIEGGHKFYKITVNNWYAFGRFGADNGQKLELDWNQQQF